MNRLWTNFRAAGARLYDIGGGPSRVVPMEGLRGLAVLLVFFVHLHALFGQYATRNKVVFRGSEFMGYVGNAGVDLFFVLSGYLIYGALIKRKVGYGKFLRRRVERIYPTFLAVLALYLVLSMVFPAENKIHGDLLHSGAFVLANLALLPGFFEITPIITVAWSLSFEFFFYILAPLIVAVLALRGWRLRYRLGFLLASWIALAIAMYSVHGNHIRMISFISGAILYEATRNAGIRKWLTWRGELMAVLLLPLSFALYFFVQRTASRPAYEWIFPILGLSAAFFFLVVYSCEFAGKLAMLFSWTPLRYLGNMSYSYYLIHGLTLKGMSLVFGKLFGAKPSLVVYSGGLIFGFAATWISSTLLFWLVEKRFSLQPTSRSLVVTPPLHVQIEMPFLAEEQPLARSAAAADMTSTGVSG